MANCSHLSVTVNHCIPPSKHSIANKAWPWLWRWPWPYVNHSWRTIAFSYLTLSWIGVNIKTICSMFMSLCVCCSGTVAPLLERPYKVRVCCNSTDVCWNHARALGGRQKSLQCHLLRRNKSAVWE